MKTKILLLVTALSFMLCIYGQRPEFNLTFNAFHDDTQVQLDSILIRNQTQECDTMLYYPYSTLKLTCIYVDLSEYHHQVKRFQVFQNYPNPVTNQTAITLFMPEKQEVGIVISDIMGRVVQKSEWLLEEGYHSFNFIPGESGIYSFNAFWHDNSSSIKIISLGNSSCRKSKLEYTGSKIKEPEFLKIKADQDFFYNCDDDLLFIGFAETLQGLRGSDIIEDTPSPLNDTSYTFEITEGVPCIDIPLVEIAETMFNLVKYRTVQIGTQCWLKKNLNRGTMILGIGEQTDNGILEKYCFDDDTTNCGTYGGLYLGKEAMKYSDEEGAQGICPLGWHIATDEEWKQLEGEVDSQYGYPDEEWDKLDYRGYDVGRRLKTQTGWDSNIGIDYVGFSWLPSGTRRFDGVFLNMGSYSGIWSSSSGSSQGNWYRFTEAYTTQVSRTHNSNLMGRPVRCIKD